jgi:hypothetical protein
MQIIIPVHRHLHRQAAPYILVVCFLLRMPRVVNAIRDVRLIRESLFSWKKFFRLQIFFKLKIVFAATASLMFDTDMFRKEISNYLAESITLVYTVESLF